MTALSENRSTVEVLCGAMNLTRVYTVKTGNTIYAGSIVAIDATGYAVPASDATGLLVVGVAQCYAAAGEAVAIKSGVFMLENDTASNALADAANLNNLCYVKDDQTVTSSAGSHAVKAGVFRGVNPDGSGVMVEIGNIRTT